MEDKRKLLHQEQRILDLAGHRAALQPGEACPLCGSTKHPSITAYAALDVSSTEQALKDKQLALQNKSKEALATDVAIAASTAKIKALGTRIDTWLEDEARPAESWRKLCVELGLGAVDRDGLDALVRAHAATLKLAQETVAAVD